MPEPTFRTVPINEGDGNTSTIQVPVTPFTPAPTIPTSNIPAPGYKFVTVNEGDGNKATIQVPIHPYTPEAPVTSISKGQTTSGIPYSLVSTALRNVNEGDSLVAQQETINRIAEINARKQEEDFKNKVKNYEIALLDYIRPKVSATQKILDYLPGQDIADFTRAQNDLLDVIERKIEKGVPLRQSELAILKHAQDTVNLDSIVWGTEGVPVLDNLVAKLRGVEDKYNIPHILSDPNRFLGLVSLSPDQQKVVDTFRDLQLLAMQFGEFPTARVSYAPERQLVKIPERGPVSRTIRLKDDVQLDWLKGIDPELLSFRGTYPVENAPVVTREMTPFKAPGTELPKSPNAPRTYTAEEQAANLAAARAQRAAEEAYRINESRAIQEAIQQRNLEFQRQSLNLGKASTTPEISRVPATQPQPETVPNKPKVPDIGTQTTEQSTTVEGNELGSSVRQTQQNAQQFNQTQGVSTGANANVGPQTGPQQNPNENPNNNPNQDEQPNPEEEPKPNEKPKEEEPNPEPEPREREREQEKEEDKTRRLPKLNPPEPKLSEVSYEKKRPYGYSWRMGRLYVGVYPPYHQKNITYSPYIPSLTKLVSGPQKAWDAIIQDGYSIPVETYDEWASWFAAPQEGPQKMVNQPLDSEASMAANQAQEANIMESEIPVIRTAAPQIPPQITRPVTPTVSSIQSISPRGSSGFAWQEGELFIGIYPPFDEDNIVYSQNQPYNTTMCRGPKQAWKRIKSMGYEIPADTYDEWASWFAPKNEAGTGLERLVFGDLGEGNSEIQGAFSDDVDNFFFPKNVKW